MRFLLDHDVPIEVKRLLANVGHETQRVVEVLPVRASDAAVFDYAQQAGQVMITCNRQDYLHLTRERTHEGLIILIRRQTRQAECARVLRLLRSAGETGIKGNVNFA